jgi:hypothetical protein
MPPNPTISDECQRLLAQVRQRCPGLLPPDPVEPGTVVGTVHLNPDEAARLFPAAAAVAAGFDPIAPEPPGPVLWREGDRELLVDTAKVVARFGSGVIAVSIPVSCDQTRPAFVHVSFVVGKPEEPAGLVATTEDRPRGPAVVVDAWADNLVAFAWHIVLEVVTNVAGEAGRDLDGSRLVPIGIAANPDGLFVVPMARHTFDRTRS